MGRWTTSRGGNTAPCTSKHPWPGHRSIRVLNPLCRVRIIWLENTYLGGYSGWFTRVFGVFLAVTTSMDIKVYLSLLDLVRLNLYWAWKANQREYIISDKDGISQLTNPCIFHQIRRPPVSSDSSMGNGFFRHPDRTTQYSKSREHKPPDRRNPLTNPSLQSNPNMKIRVK